jgi:hypothetical protein
MTKLKIYSIFVLLGGLIFWLTDIAIHFLTRFSIYWLIGLTVLTPIVVVVAYYKIRKRIKSEYRVGLPFFMFIGIWFFGPLGMGIGAMPTGGTFFSSGNFKGILTLWAAFPLTTWMMSAYSGSMFGILITTFILLLFTANEGSKASAAKRHKMNSTPQPKI